MHVRRQQIISALRLKGGTAPLSTLRAIPGLGASALLNHHLDQLVADGYVKFDRDNKIATLVKEAETDNIVDTQFIRIPIYGSANCGPGTFFADNTPSDYLTVTTNALNDLARKAVRTLAAVRAVGDSMNDTNIGGKKIEDGDIVIVNKADTDLIDGRRFLVGLNGMAMIKRLGLRSGESYGLLLSDSTEKKDPIVVTPSDNFAVSGRVIQVFKHAA